MNLRPEILITAENGQLISKTYDIRVALGLEKKRKLERKPTAIKFYLEELDKESLLHDRQKLVIEEKIYRQVTRNELAKGYYERYTSLLTEDPTPDETPIAITPLFSAEHLAEVDHQLIKKEWIARSDVRAEFVYFEPYLRLQEALKKLYRSEVAKDYSLTRFAILTTWNTLCKTSFLRTMFPEFYFYGRVHTRTPEYCQLFRKRAYLRNEVVPEEAQKLMDPNKGILNYSSCNGLWAAIENKNYPEDLIRYYDNSTPSLRYEGQATRSLIRLDSFRRFQLVFIGSESKVKEEVLNIESRIDRFFSLLQISTRKVKTTPWDGNSGSKDRKRYTTDWEVPLAANLNLELGNVSFNDRVFTKPFHVKCKNEAAYSGCSGLGLQRLIYAIVCCHGFEDKNWPIALRELL